MRCKELKKGDPTYDRGVICMTIDGLPDEVHRVEKVLDQEFSNTYYEEEGDKEGEVSISYIIDRNQKLYFLSAYKTAKGAK